MNRWVWVFEYGVACFLALVLAALLGNSQLFQNATLGRNGLTASDVVWFLGAGAVLLLVWFAAPRVATSLPDDGSWQSLLRRAVTPVATLIVLALGYQVPLFVLRPFLNDTAMMVYRWLFVVAISGAAFWFAWTSYRNAGLLVGVFARLARSLHHDAAPRPDTTSAPAGRCSQCGAELPPGVTSCQKCGRRLSAA